MVYSIIIGIVNPVSRNRVSLIFRLDLVKEWAKLVRMVLGGSQKRFNFQVLFVNISNCRGCDN